MKGADKMSKLSTQAEQIAKSFPELKTADIQACDNLIKSKIVGYTNPKMFDMVAKLLVNEIEPKLSTSNHKKVMKKCKNLAEVYLKNDEQFLLQENWFCLLAYFISIVAMICRVLNLNTQTNDWISFGAYFAALVIWLFIVKVKNLMSRKMLHFLNCFNRCAPSMTIISNLVFYAFLLAEFGIALLGVVTVGSLVITMALTVEKYNRTK